MKEKSAAHAGRQDFLLHRHEPLSYSRIKAFQALTTSAGLSAAELLPPENLGEVVEFRIVHILAGCLVVLRSDVVGDVLIVVLRCT